MKIFAEKEMDVLETSITNGLITVLRDKQAMNEDTRADLITSLYDVLSLIRTKKKTTRSDDRLLKYWLERELEWMV